MYWLQFPPTFSFLARLRVASNNDDNGDEDINRFMFVCMCAL